MPIPVILVDGLAPPPLGTKAHGTKANGATVALSLASSLGIDSIEWRVSAPTGSAAAIASAFPAAPYSTTLGPLATNETYVITAIANGDPEQIAQAAIMVPSSTGLRTPRAGETSQWDPHDGFEPDWRALVAAVTAGGYAPPGDATKVLLGTGAASAALPDTLTVTGTALSTIKSGAAAGATAVQGTGTTSQVLLGTGAAGIVPVAALPATGASKPIAGISQPASSTGLFLRDDGTFAAASAAAGSTYSASFTNSDLAAHILTVSHSLGVQYVTVSVYDNTGALVVPDGVTATSTTACAVDLTSYGTLTGTWHVVAISGGGAMGPTGATGATGAAGASGLTGGTAPNYWYVETARVDIANDNSYHTVWSKAAAALGAWATVDVEAKLVLHDDAAASTNTASVSLGATFRTDASGNPTQVGSTSEARPWRSAASTSVAWRLIDTGTDIVLQAKSATTGLYRAMAIVTVAQVTYAT